MLTSRTLYFPSLPPALDGIKLFFISDLHYWKRRSFLYEQLAAHVRAATPDVLIFGGDFLGLGTKWRDVQSWLRALPDVPCKVAVAGNWEYYSGETFSFFERKMADAGVVALCDQSLRFIHRSAEIRFVGVDDSLEGMPSVRTAFRGVTNETFNVVVSHSPDIIPEVSLKPYQLILCGHTHGGQFCVPGIGAFYTNTREGRKYAQGLYQLGREQYAYVTRGIGEGIVKWRLFCPPEAVLITLKHQWLDRPGVLSRLSL